MMEMDNCMANPRTQTGGSRGGVHSSSSSSRPLGVNNQLPDTMEANQDGTLAIYTPSFNEGGKMEIYTEIPCIVLHGMQTRERDTCQVVGSYVDMDLCQKGVGSSMDFDLQHVQSKSFAEEVVEGRVTSSLLVAAVAAASMQFLVGYNIVSLNTTEPYVFPGHNTLRWSFAVGSLAIGAVFGSQLGGALSDAHGRRTTLILNSLLLFMGGCLQTFAPNLSVLTMARFLLGIASGVSTVLVPTFLGELAPVSLRGALGTVNQFAYTIGILTADLVSFHLASEDGWHYMFSLTIFVSTLLLLSMPFVVESPRWLVQQNPHDLSLARENLKKLRGGGYEHHEVEDELDTYIQASISKHKVPCGGPQGDLWGEMLSKPHCRYIFFCILFLHTSQQLSGISAVFYYSTSLFEGIIDNPLIGTTMIGAVNVLFTYVALLLMDSCRRKSLILWSMCGMLGACTTLILSHSGVFGSSVALVAVNAYVAFFEIGMGPIPWLIIAELVEAKYVAMILSICSQLSWVVNFVVSLVFPTLNKILGEYTFVPFGTMLMISILFTWVALPETLGKTIAQVTADVQQKRSNLSELEAQVVAGIRSQESNESKATKG